MKRFISLLAFAICLLLSCEQPVIIDHTGGDADDNLLVSIYKIEQQPFGSELTRAIEAGLCNRLCFAVYDVSGKRLKQVNQKAGDAGFGTVGFQLPEGHYQVVVVGHNSDGNPTMTDPQKIKFDNADGYSDTFLHSEQVEVTDDPIELSVELQRIVSLCRFVVTDDVPDQVTRLRFYYTGGSGAFDAKTGLGSVNSKQTVMFDVEPGQKQFDLYTFLRDATGTLNLVVTAYDDADNIIQEREFEVPMTRRMITQLAGPYFTSAGSSAISIVIGINDEWEGEQTITFE